MSPSRLALAAQAIALLTLVTAATLAPPNPRGAALVLVVGGALAAATNGAYAVRLMLLAARRHFVAMHAGPCYSAGLLGVGLFAASVSGAAVAISGLRQIPPGIGVSFAALALAACVYLPGMLLLPGAAASRVARLRRGLDGLGVGVCLLFSGWVLVIAPNGSIGGPGFWVIVLTSCTLSVCLVAGLGAVRHRRGAWACASGAALSMAALAGLTLELNGVVLHPRQLALCTGMLLVAPAVAWLGVQSTGGADDLTGEAETRLASLASFPVLAVPVAAAISVASQRLVAGGRFDEPSVVLGVAGIVVLALRETFATLDVSRYAQRVVHQEVQFRTLVAASTDVIIVLDGDLVVRWQSPAAARQFGLSDQDVVGRHLLSMLHPADAVAVGERLASVRAGQAVGREHPVLVEARLRDSSGTWRETESSVSDLREVPEVAGLVVHIRDITERKELERTLHRLAHADQLTGLANRRQLLRSIVELQSVQRVGGALLLIELDGFTEVNSVRGYPTGDAVLVEVARRLRTGVAETDLAARLCGDEFAVLTETSPVRAYALATRLASMLAEPIVLPGATVHLTASLGLSAVGGGANGDEMLRRASLALRRARQMGRGRVEWFDEAVEQVLVRQMTLEQDLPVALRRNELDLIYQPILDLAADRPFGVEALLRWRHPELGMLLPADIIPIAEDLGLIGELGHWVVGQACRQLAMWLREGRDLCMAVNVSARQLDGRSEARIDVCAGIAGMLAAYDLAADRLVVEVAETGFGTDTDLMSQRLRELRALGVRTALDEFGMAVDSLTYLRRLPVDMVKLGRSFLDERPEHPDRVDRTDRPDRLPRSDRAGMLPIVDVMVGLGRRLGIDVVAQSLETQAQLDSVRAAGCRLGQGHVFARPQPAERTEAYLDGFRTRSS